MISLVFLGAVVAWAYSLYPGQVINVRRPKREMDSSRLDDNPQWGRAMADLTIAAALLLAAGAVSGQLKRRQPRYLTAPAVVTAIEPVRTGDEGLAVFPPDQPDLATFRPLGSA